MLLPVGRRFLFHGFPSAVCTPALPKGETHVKESPMSSKSLAVNQVSPPAYTAIRTPRNGSDDDLMRANKTKLEAFARRIAWAFASIVALLVIVSLLLVVAGYAGTRFALH